MFEVRMRIAGELLPQLKMRAFWGSESARRLGPTPRGRLKFGRVLACRTRKLRIPY